MIHITATGRDDLGDFTVSVPGSCEACKDEDDKYVEVSIKYNPNQVQKALRELGIDPSNPSLILKRPWQIGVSCGCYARWMRQVAHISKKREGRAKKP